MTDTSDTQTNPKTQPLYFMTWDEVEEGQEVIIFSAPYHKTSGLVYAAKEDGCLIYTNGSGNKQEVSSVPEKYKYLPIPQDRPKPNIWDEWVSGGHDIEMQNVDIIGGVVHISHDYIDNNRDICRALAAWINHVLDGE